MLRQAHVFHNHQLAIHRRKHQAMQQRKQKMMGKKAEGKRVQAGNIPTVVKDTEVKIEERVEGNNSGHVC